MMKDTYRGFWRRQRSQEKVVQPNYVSVVCPSGRSSWPVQTEAGEHDYVEGRYADVRFSYPVHFVPKGRRTAYIGQVWDRVPVMFRTALPTEIETACVVHRRGAEDTEVVAFDGRLWWSQPGDLRVQKLAAALAAGEQAAVGMLDPGSVSKHKAVNSKEDLGAREIIRDGRDQCIANLNRGAARVLKVDDRVFVQGDAPLYSLWDGYRNNSITSVGTSDVIVELSSSRRNLAYEDVSNELIFGVLFAVPSYSEMIEYAEAEKLVLEEQMTVDVMRPELLALDPMQAQLEATARKLLRLLAIYRPGAEAGATEWSQERVRLSDLLGEATSAFDYGCALQSFLKWTAGEQPWKSKFRVERLFIRDAIDRFDSEFLRRGEISPFSSPKLADEDDAAISAFSS